MTWTQDLGQEWGAILKTVGSRMILHRMACKTLGLLPPFGPKNTGSLHCKCPHWRLARYPTSLREKTCKYWWLVYPNHTMETDRLIWTQRKQAIPTHRNPPIRLQVAHFWPWRIIEGSPNVWRKFPHESRKQIWRRQINAEVQET